MKALAIVAGVILTPVILVFFWWMGTTNGLVRADEQVGQSYAQVQNVMQRQADLIPNLVETVKGAASFEKGTLTALAEARSQLTAVAKMDPEKLANNPALQKQLVEAQAQMHQALMQVQATREAYPTLKANDNFIQLMAQLEGSQNRITTERRKNQQAVQAFNVRVRSFPASFVANSQGYHVKPYFEATEGAQRAPTVKF